MLLWILLTHYNDFHKSGCINTGDGGKVGATAGGNEMEEKQPHGIAANHND